MIIFGYPSLIIMAALYTFKCSKNIAFWWQRPCIFNTMKKHNYHLGDEYISRGIGIEQDDAIFFLYQ